MIFNFPKNFYWGTASSSHQVEGGNHNDITEWEKMRANWLADEARNPKSHWTAWQREKFPEMFSPDNYISGMACDHYNRFEEDYDLAKKFHNNALRFSIEWSRIQPEPDRFDEKEINHYKNVVRALKKRGIEPFVTLWHYTSPVWLYDKKTAKGGWDNPQTVNYFVKYVEKMADVFKDDIKYWIILNEPEIYSAGAYLSNLFPPRKFSPVKFLLMMHRFINAHNKSYDVVKKKIPGAQIGMAKSYWYFEPKTDSVIDRLLTRTINHLWNHIFIEKVLKRLDFIGINFYDYVKIGIGEFERRRSEIVNDMGFTLSPEAIYHVLKEANRFKKPIYITENGVSDSEDVIRPWFLKEYIKNVAKALKQGVDIRGYFYWSLTDNFEWNKGFWPQHGLVRIDYKTQKRTIRPSAWIYTKICRENEIEL